MSPSPKPSEAAENPDSPTTTSPEPTPPPAMPVVPVGSLFLPPKGRPAPYPPPSPSSSTSPNSPSPSSQDDDAAAPTWSGDFEASAETSAPSSSSDTPSTGSGISVSRAGLRAAIAQGIRTVTGVVCRVAATPLEQSFNVWRADDEDVRDISGPASRMIWRRVPPEARNSDTVDLVVLGLALIGYVAKAMDNRYDVRRKAAAGELPGQTAPAAAPAADTGPQVSPAWSWPQSPFKATTAAPAAAAAP